MFSTNGVLKDKIRSIVNPRFKTSQNSYLQINITGQNSFTISIVLSLLISAKLPVTHWFHRSRTGSDRPTHRPSTIYNIVSYPGSLSLKSHQKVQRHCVTWNRCMARWSNRMMPFTPTAGGRDITSTHENLLTDFR